MLTVDEATTVVLDRMGPDTVIRSVIEYQGDYLFLAVGSNPDEGEYDPFVKVNATSGKLWDFSPQDYDNPREVLEQLTANLP